MEWTRDVSLGQWIVEGTSGHLGNGVNDLVPRGFEAYARIPHPDDIGRLPVLPQVVRLLMDHTSTPTDATAAIWEGWGGLVSSGGRATLMLGEVRAYQSFLAQALWALQQQWWRLRSRFEPSPQPGSGILPAEVATGPKLEMPDRAYFLARLDLHDLAEDDWENRVLWADPPLTENPSLLWPDDRAWVLATEIDLDWTVVAGSRDLVRALVQSGLRTVEIPPTTDMS